MAARSRNQAVISLDAVRTFREQTIDDEHPGPILHDFGVLLDFIGPAGVRSTARRGLLPGSCLVELNSRMGRPLAVRLKRPQQQSYPNLHGLYLVGRCSGLIQAKAGGTKGCLVVDEEVHELWQGLNATERYFALLEAWLLNGRPEVVGERRTPVFGCLTSALMLWEALPKDGLQIDDEVQGGRYVAGAWATAWELMLMDMFGLLAVDQGPPVEGRTWQPKAIRRTAWGRAIFRPLRDPDHLLRILCEGEPKSTTSGGLREVFGPFVPAWQKDLEISAPAFRKGVWVFGVSLGRARRRIGLSAGRTLDDLAVGIVHAFNFDLDHLYSFTCADRFGGSTRFLHPFCEESPSTADVRLGDLPLADGEAMEFLYDFGDCWSFNVRLVRVDPSSRGFDRPRVLESHGTPPDQYGYPEEE